LDLYVIFGHLLLILGFLLAAVIVAHVLRRGGSPSGTIAWLLVVVLIPYVGVPLYLILGERKMRRAAGRKAGIKLPQIDTLPLAEANLLDRLLRSYDCPGATRGNRLDLCRTGEESYACLIDLIAQATRRICITTYVLGQDEVGRDIVERLARRAAEGIEVRLLIDDLGSARTKRRMLEPLIQAGGQAASFMPVLHLPLRGRANLRNHRKLVLVDDRLVMAGGTNIASEYIGPTPKPGRWRDISFLLQGPAVRHYAQIFYSDWEFASGERLPFNPASAQPISGPGDG